MTPEARRRYWQKKRLRERASGRRIRTKKRDSLLRQLAARDGAHCRYCEVPFTSLRQATIDHVVPFCICRSWELEFLALACHWCNIDKGDMAEEDFTPRTRPGTVVLWKVAA